MKKKGQVLSNLGALGVGVASLAIVLVVAMLIMAQANSNMKTDGSACENTSMVYNTTTSTCNLPADVTDVGGFSHAWNSTAQLQTAAATIPNWVSIIIITAIGSILISMVALFRR